MTKFTRTQLVQNAAQFTSLSAWVKGDSAAYNQARLLGIQKHIAGVLGWEVHKKPKWDYESLLEEARQYVSRLDWAIHDMASYGAAGAKGHIDKIEEELGWE